MKKLICPIYVLGRLPVVVALIATTWGACNTMETPLSHGDMGPTSMCQPAVDFDTDPKNCGACGHSCLGGGCSGAICEPVKLSSFALKDPLSRSLAGPMLAAQATDVFIATGEVTPSIFRVDLSTGMVTPLHPFEGAIEATYPIISGSDLFFDAQGMGLAGQVYQVPVAGAAMASAIHATDAQASAMFTVDDQYLYWYSAALTGDQAIYRSARGSSGDKAPIVSLPHNQYLMGLTVNHQSVFAVTPTGIFSVPKVGASSPTILDTTPIGLGVYLHGPTRVAVADDDYVYWLGDANPAPDGKSALRRTTVASGGAAETLATTSDSGTIVGLAIDDTRVYWIVQGMQASAIQAMTKGTKKLTTIASLPGAKITDLVVGQDAVWWVTDETSAGSLYRVAK